MSILLEVTYGSLFQKDTDRQDVLARWKQKDIWIARGQCVVNIGCGGEEGRLRVSLGQSIRYSLLSYPPSQPESPDEEDESLPRSIKRARCPWRFLCKGTQEEEKAFWLHLRNIGFVGRFTEPVLHEAFERILDESPGDWLTRQVYADWLEEHGEEMYAFAQRWMNENKKMPTRWPLYWSWDAGTLSGSYHFNGKIYITRTDAELDLSQALILAGINSFNHQLLSAMTDASEPHS